METDDRGPRVCCDCRCGHSEENPVEWGPEPYRHDIDGDDTLCWQCARCADSSAGDI